MAAPATGMMASFSPPMASGVPPGAMTSFAAPMAPPMGPMMTAGNPTAASMPPMDPMTSSMPAMMAPPMTSPDPMASMPPMPASMPPRTGPLDPMASMPPMTSPLADPMSSFRPPRTTPLVDPMASMPPMTTPNPMASMPPMTTPNPYASMPPMAPNPYASMPPMVTPGTTPLDPAGPLPSDIFSSAAAVPTQLYSTGTFPASGTMPPDGFASAASMTTPASPTKPSLWSSTTGAASKSAAAGTPAAPTINPFATAGAKADATPGPISIATPPGTAAAADTVGNGDVTLRVSRLLDIPKESAVSGSYYVEISTKDKKTTKIGPFEASPTGEITEDVDVKSGEGDLTVTTGSPEIVVQVSRAGRMYGSTLIGEASIHRLDPRSRGVCAYALSSKATPHPGGIELVVLERPPGKAAAHEPEGLLPAQHHVMGILDIEKLVMLPPVSGMSLRDQVEIRIEPLDKMSAGYKKDLSTVLGPYSTKPDPTKTGLRMVDVRERVEYKGMFRADRGGLKRLRVSAWYQGVFGAGDEIGGVDVDVTFAVAPVNIEILTKKDAKEQKGSIYIGHKLVEEMEWRKTKEAMGGGKLLGSEKTEFDPTSAHSAVPMPKGAVKPKGKDTADDLFPAPVSDTEKEQIKKLQEQLNQLSLENDQTKTTIEKMKTGDFKPSKFDEAMKALGPPHLNPEVPLAPGLTAALFPVKVPKEEHVDDSGVLSMQARENEAGHLQSTSIYEVETRAHKPMLAPGNMVDPDSLPDVSLRFQDVNPRYTVSDDVWGLAQKNHYAAAHASNTNGGRRHQHQKHYRHPKVREDCILT